MKKIQIAAFLLAVAFMGGIMLFGGLLFMPMHGGRQTLEDVAIEEQVKPEDKQEQKKELAEEKKAAPEAPPELKESAEAPPLGLDALSDALNPGGGEGGDSFFSRGAATLGARAAIEASAIAAAGSEQVFSLSDLDQAPRVVFQPAPEYPAALRKQKLDGTVHVLFLVDKAGRVEGPVAQKTTHPAFEQPALQAVKRWRFEPGKRNGESVPFRMRVPITFKSR
jgi:protein TonB